MKFTVDHDLHIHSFLSSCSRDPEQSAENILKYAEKNGITKLCVTDHFWDKTLEGASNWYKEQDFSHVAKILPLPKKEGIEFHFGCETELNGELTLGISKEAAEKFDFIIIPTTHLHMNDYTIAANASAEERAAAYIKRLDAVLDMDLPFHKIGIAHLACHLIDKANGIGAVLPLISDGEYDRLFAKAAKKGVGIELNASDFDYASQDELCRRETLRVFSRAKAMGCKFYLGSDAHHPQRFETCVSSFEYAIDALGLTENDKFRPFN